MYLKSIEIQGFKSFANKIVFEFHNGITGIVGPNGSGKSNVADAVRWVLGEQKVKQLRGASMQDVIFSGTELRKPQGFAFVAITLDNSDHQLPIDYNQVTVSRRLYRSGESEYKINGSICRLKDINELFYDTGIGKEGYSIIGQGQIDKILSGKPEERRELFDEAAGIVKFKKRKVIAQRKLEDEKQNLVRIHDILAELEKQVEPLAKQSETAKQYLHLKEELKVYDVHLFLAETAGIRTQMQTLGEHQATIQTALEQANTDAQQMKMEYEKLDEQLVELDQTITKQRDSLSQGTVLKGSLEGQINVLAEQINTETMNETHIHNRLETITQEMAGKTETAARYRTEYQQIIDQLAQSQQKKAQAEAEQQLCEDNIREIEQQLEAGKNNILSLLNEKSSVLTKQQRYETMLEQVQVRKAEIAQRLLKSKSDESVQHEQQKIELSKLQQLTKQKDDFTSQKQIHEELVLKTEQELRCDNRLLNDKQQEYHRCHTKLESFKNLSERYEGYGNSIRRVMEVKEKIAGIRGVVADLITTPKQYEVAIETALGGSIQNIVTDSDQTAKQLIEYLKKNKYGRATFLPLSSMKQSGHFQQEAALQEPGVIGLASQLVHADPEYQNLVRYLLGRIVVVDVIDHAMKLAKKFNFSLRIVTLEGELLNAGGSMTGGAFKNTSNLLGRRREIEELEQQCQKVIAETTKLKQHLEDAEEVLRQEREALEMVKQQIQQLNLEQNTLQITIQQLEQKKVEIMEGAKDLNLENTQIEAQIYELMEHQQQTTEKIASLEAQRGMTDEELSKLTQQLEQERLQREEVGRHLSERQIEYANYQQKHQFAKENEQRIAQELHKLQTESESLATGTDLTQSAIKQKQSEIETITQRIASLLTDLGAAEQTVTDLLKHKEMLMGQQKGFFQKREELSDQVNLLDKEGFRLQTQAEKLEERLEQYTNYMWEEYQLTYSTAEGLRPDETVVLGELKKMIASIKEQIKKLGNVNVNAIEDYKELFERYEFMKTQYNDLKEAEETLLTIIAELDSGMRKQFEEKFAEIKAEFDKVFRELFGGGHGTLELMEEEDILTAGIQIISQPPGKKLQNMMQLSGGEKALTAISLLFAIQNLKPSPFCLLDEIEAALDDSNVDRFAGYLHKLIQHTQFIIITHRRGTMVAADRLYGITMQEKGISTLVSVNLIADQLEDSIAP